MNINTTFFISGRNKAYLLSLLLLLMSSLSYSQSCDCPTLDSCGSCEGGLTALTVQYDGGLVIVSTSASDDEGSLSSTLLSNTIVINKGNNEPFVGAVEISVFALIGSATATIPTSCDPPVYEGSEYGNFTVLDGVSVEGGALCCSNADTPTNPPIISGCPDDIVVSADAFCQAVVTWTPPTANNDNCGDSSPAEITVDYNPGDTFSLGTTIVTYTATDDYGNKATCTFGVSVQDDTGPMLISRPADIEKFLGPSECSIAATWDEPIFSDNCTGESDLNIQANYAPGHIFSAGKEKVTYTATDRSGNISTCSFYVIVKDKIKPTISGDNRGTIIAETVDSSCEAIVTWRKPSGSDNCNFVLTPNYPPGFAFPVGDYEIIYTAEDGSGNTSEYKFKVKVKDKTKPEVVGYGDIRVTATGSSCYTTATWTEPTATDNCDGVRRIFRSHAPGDTFLIGRSTRVTYTFEDASGNSSGYSFNVIVGGSIDNDAPPVISGCPDDIIVKVEAGASGDKVNWVPPIATASCGELNPTSTHEPNSFFPIGITPVTYTFLAPSGKTSSCSFRVIVSYEDITLDIAKVVTPDGNGINDEWIISNVENYQENKVVIVDRWGSVVFSASGYNNEDVVWKGTNRNGVLVPTGTYFYTMSIRSANGHAEKQGFIELIR